MKRALSIIIALAAALSLFGCAAKSSAAEDSYDYANTQMAPAEAAAAPEAPAAEAVMARTEEGYAKSPSGVYDSGSGVPANQYGNHKIITTYYIGMRTDEFDLHLSMLQEKAVMLGGYVQSSGVEGTKPLTYHDSGRWATFSFRIPSERAAEFVEFSKGTGEITSSSIDTNDVTLEYYDSETRLEVLRTQLERLQSILVETDNLADIIELERAIAEVTLEIEQLTTGLRKYDNLIEFTTVNIDIHENRLAKAPAAELTFGQRVTEGFGENLHSLLITIEDMTVWFIINLPALLLIALIAFGGVRLIKRIRNKRHSIRADKEEKHGKAKETKQD